MNNKLHKIGVFTKKIIDLLGLNIEPDTPIMIGKTNIEHIKNRHPYEYDKYINDIENIIQFPDYVGVHPNDKSVLYVKEYLDDEEYIRVAVRITPAGKCYAKTLHLLSTCNAERYIEKGTLIKLDNQSK